MRTEYEQVSNSHVIDLIKKRMLAKIEALFELGTAKDKKHFEINSANLKSIINKGNASEANINEIKQRMIDAIINMDLNKYKINASSSYKDGVIACIQALKDIGISTEDWNFGTNNIQDVLIFSENKLYADREKELKKEKIDYLEKLKKSEIKFKDIPEHYKRDDDFIISLIDLELKLKPKAVLDREIEENDFQFIHPFLLFNEHFSSRSEKAQNHILKLLDTMSSISMRQLTQPSTSIFKRLLKKYAPVLNESICIYTIQHDVSALEYLPKEFQRNERILEAALIQNAAQLEFVSVDLKQKLIDKLKPENLLNNNMLAYKYFPKSENNTYIINSFFAKTQNIILNPTLNDAELRDAVSKELDDIKLMASKLTKEGHTFFISADSMEFAKEKAIIDEFLISLLQVSTAEEYCNKITDFMLSEKYKNLYQIENQQGTGANLLFDALYSAALQYVNLLNQPR